MDENTEGHATANEGISCDIGKSNGFQLSCSRTIQSLIDHTEEEYELVKRRIHPKPCSRHMTLCESHKNRFLVQFEFNHKWCCDPFQVHKTRNNYRLSVIDLALARDVDRLQDFQLIPGQKICFHCNRRVLETLKTPPTNEVTSETSQETPINEVDSQPSQGTTTNAGSSQSSSEDFLCTQTAKTEVEKIFNVLHISPLKIQNHHHYAKRDYAKRKLLEVHDSAELRLKKMLKLDANLEIGVDSNVRTEKETFSNILEELKEKFRESGRDQNLQILTIVVGHLKSTEIIRYFETSRHMVDQAVVLKENSGILAVPNQKIGRQLPEETKQVVIDFYSDRTLDHIRMLPGKKDYVSVGKGEHVQKRLILCNLRELYSNIKEEYPNLKIGFSIFCSLRPKYSVLAGSPGTHIVCVCTTHQNVKLLLYAVNTRLDYKEIISKIVCNQENLTCMIRSCFECNGFEYVRNILQETIFPNTDLSDDDVICYKEWTQTDRAELVTKNCSYGQYLDLIVEKFETLIPHQYIAGKQGEYLKSRKSNLPNDTALVLFDFSENYHFVIQNEIQASYWTKNSCTVHPVVVYFQNGDALDHFSLCILSEDTKHDVAAVKVFQKYVIHHIKEKLPHIKVIQYFSDGCAGQYKNCANFLQLCKHKETYELDAEWIFFATSHVKSPCDGIGELVKREAAKESLRRPFEKQILTVNDLHDFCNTSLPSIKSILVSKTELTQERAETRGDAQTIPGTRGYHHFIPITERVVACKITSFHQQNSIKFDLLNKNVYNWVENIFVTFVNQNNWSVGYIVHISETELIAEISMMQMIRKNTYKWPDTDTWLSIPFTDILCEITVIEKGSEHFIKLGHTISKFKKYKCENPSVNEGELSIQS